MKIVSWYPVLTDHMSYTLEALQQEAGCDLVVNVSNDEHAARQAQGWVRQHVTAIPVVRIPTRRWLRYVLAQLRLDGEAVHLFGSPFEQPRMTLTMLLAVMMGRKVFLISEPYSPIASGYQDDRAKAVNWIKAKLRPLVYLLYGIMLRRRLAGVFAISPLAVTQYQRVGISPHRIFPFGYFVPRAKFSPSDEHVASPRPKGELRLVFLGTLIARKGLDILIEAVARMRSDGESISLDVYGPGDPSHFAFDESAIRYCGTIPFGGAQAAIRGYDLLALPSRYDGWGVVVNEALLAGVPVICSDRVGASAVIKKWRCGVVFSSENVTDLYLQLKRLSADPESMVKMRQTARQAGTTLEPDMAGHYMHEVIAKSASGTIPLCPWY